TRWNPDSIRYGEDIGARVDELEEAFRVAREQAGPAPVLISYTLDRLDQLARDLGWSTLTFPPPRPTTRTYEITPATLRNVLLEAKLPTAAWILVRGDAGFARRLLESPCLVGARAIPVAPYQLLLLDGPASQQRLSTCERTW